MPVTIERLSDMPVILAHFEGYISVEDIKSVFIQSLSLVTPDETHIYRISILEKTDSSFVDAFKGIQASIANNPGTTKDSRFHPIMVGKSQWIQMFVQFMAQKQFGGITIPCFNTLDQALEYVRTECVES